MAVSMIAPVGTERKRESVPMPEFGFHREYMNHDRFIVSFTDDAGTWSCESRAWGNTMRLVNVFTSSIAHEGMCRAARVNLYRTGHALVNGYNVRISPIGEAR